MTENMQYQRWLDFPLEDPALKEELLGIKGKEEEIFDRFYQELAFGTAGLRGVLGAGTNRMNIYTVRKATQGMADYLNEKYPAASIAISYDSRINSRLFAEETARVMAANGVTAYLYDQLMPTPALSFAVRDLKCQAGVMITASHNPAKYNGYKAYGPDGCQMTDEAANAVLEKIGEIDIFDGVKVADFDQALAQGKIQYIKQEVIDRYLDAVESQSIRKGICADSGMKVVYTPLNGAGNMCVRAILDRIGVKNVVPVKEQEMPDGNFPTCPYPNPEIREALQKGLDLCETEKPDLLLATDPDCDRVGIAVPHDGGYLLLTGNEVGVLLTDYIASSRIELGTMPQNPIVVKTIVTTAMIDRLAKTYGFEVVNILTGFKYIGEQILRLEEKGEQDRYIFGFEESYGYLSGGYVRDKDAVDGSMLICEMAAYYKKQGKTLADVLFGLYEKYGMHLNTQASFTCEGASGMERMREIMDDLRINAPTEICGKKVLWMSDYQASVKKSADGEQPIHLPRSNVVEYGLEGDNVIVVRPSGTEPKIKVYFMVKGRSRAEAGELEAQFKARMTQLMGF
ncbi:MAG: phospho-sugar mutase [Oscillospiraceae bacterium]|nr:phospho-sugar mutase [Oscillospiraceae bacterium]